MLIFLAGEGPNDIGGLSASPPYQDDSPGFLQPVIQRSICPEVTFAGRKIAALGKQRIRGLKEALSHKSAVATAIAEELGADLLIVSTDLDGGSGRKQEHTVRADLERKLDAIQAGHEAAAQGPIRCIAGIPCRTVEAWA